MLRSRADVQRLRLPDWLRCRRRAAGSVRRSDVLDDQRVRRRIVRGRDVARDVRTIGKRCAVQSGWFAVRIWWLGRYRLVVECAILTRVEDRETALEHSQVPGTRRK